MDRVENLHQEPWESHVSAELSCQVAQLFRVILVGVRKHLEGRLAPHADGVAPRFGALARFCLFRALVEGAAEEAETEHARLQKRILPFLLPQVGRMVIHRSPGRCEGGAKLQQII